ncbi:uncharacterized protein LOC130785382 isoform X1 [Actinidia eriantha]|uniref:uncharacterized protein LOC130785382 isoform X1 n=1 Tax=Actinidia eriantha TaxID=165200 RepID=UPI00258830CE|nr:uncharacterized protein LOC130785382 isoform X1 [Actinidia eriantha]
MLLSLQNLLSKSNPRIYLYFTNSHFTSLKTPNFNHFSNLPHFRILRTNLPNPNNFNYLNCQHWHVKAFESDRTVRKADDGVNLDAVLSIVEFLCLASSAVISIGFAVNSAISNSQKPVLAFLGNKVFVWQFVMLVGAVVIGASIRRRQWRRMCGDVSRSGDSGVNLTGRIEKLEEDLRSSGTIVKVLSRQLEKLGIRVRASRKALKEPIAETAALAQKNSQATQALAAQEDILEKELSEIQKVLLAMQDQQQKQLGLILAIAENGKLRKIKHGPSQEKDATETRSSAEKGVKQMEISQIQASSLQKEANREIA